MKKIKQLIPSHQVVSDLSKNQVGFQNTPSDKEIAIIGEEMNRLFNQLKAIHTSWRWTWNTPEAIESAKGLWLKQFIKHGILSREQIDLGLDVALNKNKKYVPHVNEFIGWCVATGGDNIPTLEQSYQECLSAAQNPLKYDFNHKICYWSGFKMWFQLKTTESNKPSSAFEAQYNETVERFKRGELPPVPEKKLAGQIENKKGMAVTREEKAELKDLGKSKMAEIMANIKV